MDLTQVLGHSGTAVAEDRVVVGTAEEVGHEDQFVAVQDRVCDQVKLAAADIEAAVAMGLDLVVVQGYIHSSSHFHSAYSHVDCIPLGIVVLVEVAAASRLAFRHVSHFASAVSRTWSVYAFDSYSVVQQKRSLSVIFLKEGHQICWRMPHPVDCLMNVHSRSGGLHLIVRHCNLPFCSNSRTCSRWSS